LSTLAVSGRLAGCEALLSRFSINYLFLIIYNISVLVASDTRDAKAHRGRNAAGNRVTPMGCDNCIIRRPAASNESDGGGQPHTERPVQGADFAAAEQQPAARTRAIRHIASICGEAAFGH
jgi:hypothetical protein